MLAWLLLFLGILRLPKRAYFQRKITAFVDMLLTLLPRQLIMRAFLKPGETPQEKPPAMPVFLGANNPLSEHPGASQNHRRLQWVNGLDRL
jgi:hypothetical protein